MSGARLGQLLLLVSIFAGAAGHTLLKRIVASLPAAAHLVAGEIIRLETIARIGLAGLLLLISFGAWLGALRHLDLSYAYAMASASIVVVALLAAALLGETIAPRSWVGLLLIVIGCVLVAPAYAGTGK